MRRKVKSNPEWTDDILYRFCEPIRSVAEAHGLPAPLLKRNCMIEQRSEIGAGDYGVVWTTEDTEVAFKLTTDSTEAHFIQTAINLRKEGISDPAGLIDYRAIFSVPVKHDGFDVFAIWREKAEHVGLPCDVSEKEEDMVSFISLLSNFYKASDAAFFAAFEEQNVSENEDRYFNWIEERVGLANRIFKGETGLYESSFAKTLAKCYRIAIDMENSGEAGRYVGEALKTYMENGMLLCDIHANNVGLVDRGKCRSIWAITDPGNVLLLRRDLSKTTIQSIGKKV